MHFIQFSDLNCLLRRGKQSFKYAKNSKKRITDILVILCLIAAIITGFILHKEVNYLYIYNDMTIWTIHEIAGLLLAVLVTLHCLQHKLWFRNYGRIKAKKKADSTGLLVIGILILTTGIQLVMYSRFHFVSNLRLPKQAMV